MRQLIAMTTIFCMFLFFCLVPMGANETVKAGNNLALDLNEWWGHESLKEYFTDSIREARIHFDDTMKQDLIQRLKNHAPLTPGLKGVAFTYGFPGNAVGDWVRYWTEYYNFFGREEFLNKFPQYKTNIQGLDIHFAWVRPQYQRSSEVFTTSTSKSNKSVDTVPLLMLHGWPGTIRDFYEVMDNLTDVFAKREFEFELVVPFLPGFGYSDGAVRPGLGAGQMAVVMRNLMRRLGYHRYYVHGGDWGAIIGSHIASLFPEEVLGYHTNWGVVLTLEALQRQILAASNTSSIVDPALADRMYPYTEKLSILLEETGYFHLAATKPDTIGIALSDSPVGLLAFMLEKISSATNLSNRNLNDGGLKNSFTPDMLIDNLMIYWASRSVTTSLRIYAETMNLKYFALGLEGKVTPVPTWVIQPKNEISYQPPAILKLKYPNLLNATPIDYGGHYFALECPVDLAESLVTAIRAMRKWHANRNTF